MIGHIDKTDHLEVRHSSSNQMVLGILFVALGASSYGMLSTFVKLAYKAGFTTAEVTVAQFSWGLILLSILNHVTNRRGQAPKRPETFQLIAAGMPLALTSVFYYLSVKYIDASIAVVLLMQVVWIGVVIEALIVKRWPSLLRILGIVFVLLGTLLATNALGGSGKSLDGRGLFFGCLSALSFSATLLASNKVASHLPAVKRSQVMIFGGFLVVLLFALLTQLLPHYYGAFLIPEDLIQNQAFNLKIFISYGFVVALFGTFIPPLMLNKGFPIIGVGLGGIISSIELPCAMTIAYLLLGEKVTMIQWMGVAVILAAIALINYRLIFVPRN